MRNIVTAATAFVFLAIAGGALFLSGLLTSQAVQDPLISIDMVTAGNTYDETTNRMDLGPVNNCLTTAAPGNNALHLHTLHVVVQNVEDLVGWQVRLNYLGDRMRPNTVNFIPFLDSNTGQNISFLNLPLDQTTLVHRDQTFATSIPPSAPGPQTAAFGSVYVGAQNFPISPDTPAKAVPDDFSYDAPTGGVVASLTAQVVGSQAGQPSLFLNMDDSTPNGPGSGYAFFDGTGSQDVLLPVDKLGDGYHGEGATCVPLNCVTPECPGPPVSVINHTFTNQTSQTASDLHIQFDGPVGPRLVQNAPGCPAPTITQPFQNKEVDVDWGVACVDDGESVVIEITSEPPAAVQCFHWTISGAPIGTPCPTATPTATATATAAPFSILVTATNDSGVTADDLHFYAQSASMSLNADVPVNAPGCATPTANAGNWPGVDFTFRVTVVWPSACVDNGESVTVRLSCPGQCTSINTFGCEDWTLSGGVIGAPCPTPNPFPTPTPTATATASPSPTATRTATATATAATATPCPTCVPSTEVTFVNDTAQAASQIHIEFPIERNTSTAGLTQNAPGCPSPTVHSTPPHDAYVTVDWGVACVDPGESVRIVFTSDSPFSPAPEVSCFYWTRLGAFIDGQSPPCAKTFVNDTGQVASDLHIVFVSDAPPISVGLVQNAPGCPSPAYSIASNVVDVDWGVACVDPGESATFVFIPPNSAQHGPAVSSFNWTFGTATPTPTPSPVPVAGHDARLTRIGGVPKNVRLLPGEVITDSASIVVANESNHSETIGVYIDVMAPTGCTPNGRVLETTVTLAAGAKTTLPVPVSYTCSDPAAANGQSYTWTAVADHGADDLSSCAAESLQGLTCFNALADDDEDPADSRRSRTGPKVVAQ